MHHNNHLLNHPQFMPGANGINHLPHPNSIGLHGAVPSGVVNNGAHRVLSDLTDLDDEDDDLCNNSSMNDDDIVCSSPSNISRSSVPSIYDDEDDEAVGEGDEESIDDEEVDDESTSSIESELSEDYGLDMDSDTETTSVRTPKRKPAPERDSGMASASNSMLKNSTGKDNSHTRLSHLHAGSSMNTVANNGPKAIDADELLRKLNKVKKNYRVKFDESDSD